jgi:hypothetical protein
LSLPFSITQRFQIAFHGAGGVVSFESLSSLTTPVPEPATLTLLLSGLPLGYTMFRRRRRALTSMAA